MSPPPQSGPDHGDQGHLQALPSTDTSVTNLAAYRAQLAARRAASLRLGPLDGGPADPMMNLAGLPITGEAGCGRMVARPGGAFVPCCCATGTG